MPLTPRAEERMGALHYLGLKNERRTKPHKDELTYTFYGSLDHRPTLPVMFR
jgi:hypothetical protein